MSDSWQKIEPGHPWHHAEHDVYHGIERRGNSEHKVVIVPKGIQAADQHERERSPEYQTGAVSARVWVNKKDDYYDRSAGNIEVHGFPVEHSDKVMSAIRHAGKVMKHVTSASPDVEMARHAAHAEHVPHDMLTGLQAHHDPITKLGAAQHVGQRGKEDEVSKKFSPVLLHHGYKQNADRPTVWEHPTLPQVDLHAERGTWNLGWSGRRKHKTISDPKGLHAAIMDTKNKHRKNAEISARFDRTWRRTESEDVLDRAVRLLEGDDK